MLLNDDDDDDDIYIGWMILHSQDEINVIVYIIEKRFINKHSLFHLNKMLIRYENWCLCNV
jgi:hypothetical protein